MQTENYCVVVGDVTAGGLQYWWTPNSRSWVSVTINLHTTGFEPALNRVKFHFPNDWYNLLLYRFANFLQYSLTKEQYN